MSESALILRIGPTLFPSNGMHECMAVSFETRYMYIGYVIGFCLIYIWSEGADSENQTATRAVPILYILN